MKKIFVLTLLSLSSPSLAVVTNFTNQCGNEGYAKLGASFTPIQYTCDSGYYLQADSLGPCVQCLRGYTCAGGIYPFNEHHDQGIVINSYTCNSGYYLPANALGCSACPTGAVCAGGTYSFNATVPQGIIYNAPFTQNQNDLCSPYYIYARADFTINQYACSSGQYLPADGIACAQCPVGSYCAGGNYTFNETTTQGISGQCTDGYSAPAGSSSASACVANTITVRWDDGNGGAYSTTCTYGGALTTPTTPPTAPRGHHFTGWTFNN